MDDVGRISYVRVPGRQVRDNIKITQDESWVDGESIDIYYHLPFIVTFYPHPLCVLLVVVLPLPKVN